MRLRYDCRIKQGGAGGTGCETSGLEVNGGDYTAEIRVPMRVRDKTAPSPLRAEFTVGTQ